MPPIIIEISPGELVDRISINGHKLVAFREDRAKWDAVFKNQKQLLEQFKLHVDAQVDATPGTQAYIHALDGLNGLLWKLEDKVRAIQHGSDDLFADTARRIFEFNLQRAATKQKINALLGYQETDLKSHKLPEV